MSDKGSYALIPAKKPKRVVVMPPKIWSLMGISSVSGREYRRRRRGHR